MRNIIFSLYRKIFARSIFSKVNYFLFHLSMRGIGILNYENSLVSGEKYLLGKKLPELINNDSPVFFDVGANIGNYTLLLSENFKNGTIYAFEPHPKNYSKLSSRFSVNNIKTYNMGMGEENSNLTLYDRADFDGSTHASLHKEVISEIHKQDIVTFDVKIDTLDNFTRVNNIEYIDFMKIDTEGNELSVLKGGKNLLKNRKIGAIHFEFNDMNIISRVFFRDFRKILQNYNLYRLLPNDLLLLGDYPLSTELFGYQNILALPK